MVRKLVARAARKRGIAWEMPGRVEEAVMTAYSPDNATKFCADM